MSWASAVRRRQGRVQRACADSLVSPAVNPRLERAVDVSWSAIWLSISRVMWISALLDVSISKSSRPRGCLCGGEPWRYLLGQQPFCSVQMLRTKPATFMLGQSEYFVSKWQSILYAGHSVGSWRDREHERTRTNRLRKALGTSSPCRLRLIARPTAW
jgi:hypothetical protein